MAEPAPCPLRTGALRLVIGTRSTNSARSAGGRSRNKRRYRSALSIHWVRANMATPSVASASARSVNSRPNRCTGQTVGHSLDGAKAGVPGGRMASFDRVNGPVNYGPWCHAWRPVGPPLVRSENHPPLMLSPWSGRPKGRFMTRGGWPDPSCGVSDTPQDFKPLASAGIDKNLAHRATLRGQGGGHP
jgi:hypothetical protein